MNVIEEIARKTTRSLSDFSGLNNSDIYTLESAINHSLPKSYKAFLDVCGDFSDPAAVSAGQMILENQEILSELIEDKTINHVIPSPRLVVNEYGGLNFWYVIDLDQDDPTVFKVSDIDPPESTGILLSDYLERQLSYECNHNRL